jgi:hypothetical protein
LLKVANPEPVATLIAKTGASKPSTTAVTIISTLFGPAKTIAIDDKPEIKLKQILQKPRVRKDTPQVINGLVPPGNKINDRNTGPTKAVTNIITSIIYKNEPLKLKITPLRAAESSKLWISLIVMLPTFNFYSVINLVFYIQHCWQLDEQD